MADTEALLRSWVAEYNRGAGWVERIADAEFEWVEQPTRAFPAGRTGTRDTLVAAANANLARTPARSMDLVTAIASADGVGVVEYVWRGVDAAGAPLEFRGASVLTFVGEKLRRQVDYICHPHVTSGPA